MDTLASKSHGSSLWLVTASFYVSQGDGAVMSAHAQLKRMPDGSKAMDPLYAAILGPNAYGVDQRTHLLRGTLGLQLHLAERCLDIMNESTLR